MGHVAGVSTETQTRLYVHYAALAAAANFAALAAVVTADNHVDLVTEIGDMGGTPDIRTFTVFGEKRKRKVAGPAEPADFEFGVTVDWSEASHQTLASKGSGDPITVAVATYDADEDNFIGPTNVDAMVASGVVSHVREVNAAGGQKMLMVGCAWSRLSPTFVTN